jgi:hypothetical protein
MDRNYITTTVSNVQPGVNILLGKVCSVVLILL